jgi:hypothetical protein
MRSFVLAHPIVTTLIALSLIGTVGYTVAAVAYRARQ